MSFILYAKLKGTCKKDSISVSLTGCCTKLSSIFALLEQLEKDNPGVTILGRVENNMSRASCIMLVNHDLTIYVDGHQTCYRHVNYELHNVALKLDHLSSIVHYKKLSGDKWHITCYNELLNGVTTLFGSVVSCRCKPNHLSLKQKDLKVLNRERVFLTKKKLELEDIDVPSLGSLFREDSEYSVLKIKCELIDQINNDLSNLLSR